MKKIVSLLLLTTGFSLQSAEQGVLENRSVSPKLEYVDSSKDSGLAELQQRISALEYFVGSLPRSRGVLGAALADVTQVGAAALEDTADVKIQNGADIQNILVQAATTKKMTLLEAERLAAELIENDVLMNALQAKFKAGKKACCISFFQNAKKESAALAHTTAQTVLAHALLTPSSLPTSTTAS